MAESALVTRDDAVKSAVLLNVTDAPKAPPRRRRTAQIGTAFGVGAMLMYFGGLIAMYVSERAAFVANPDNGSWIPSSARLELAPPTIMAWTLLMSTVTMQWAAYSFVRNDRRHGLLAVALQVVLAIAVINQTTFQWRQMGLVADDVSSPAPVMIYAITGSFVVALCAVILMLLIMSFRAAASTDVRSDGGGISAVAVMWHALVAIYFVIWIADFITK